jgi:hypothetical protein
MLKPDRSILDESFRYVPAAATSVAATWRRFGWRPTTDEERKMRRRPEAEEDAPVEAGARHRSSIPLPLSPWKEHVPGLAKSG